MFPENYMQGVRALCDKYDILLILDEVIPITQSALPLASTRPLASPTVDLVCAVVAPILERLWSASGAPDTSGDSSTTTVC